jgi:hypothetical protein
MDLIAWVPVVAVAVGGLIGWYGKAWESKASANRADQARVKERSEEAAATLIGIVDEMRAAFDQYWGQYDGPPQSDLKGPFGVMRRITLDVVPDDARRKLTQVANAFYYYHEVSPWGLRMAGTHTTPP